MSPLRVSLLEVPLLPSLIGQLLLLLCHIVLVMKCYFAELFHFNEVYYNIIFFMDYALGVVSEHSSPSPKDLSPTVSATSF